MGKNDNVNLLNVTKTNKNYGENTSKLLNFFRVAPTDRKQLIPTEPEKDKKGKPNGKYKPIDMPTSIENAYQYFVENMNTSPYMSNSFRLERYKDCRYMVETEPIMFSAVQIYISEAYTTEHGRKPIEIKSKSSKVETLFYKWINEVGFTDNIIRDALYNLIVYGDAFWIPQIDMVGKNGVTGITPLNPFLIADRIEFNVGMVNEEKRWFNSALNLANAYGSLKQIYDIVSSDNIEDISQFYQSYLFGYELKLSSEEEDSGKDVKGVPPWSVVHCRMFTTEKAFFPFGKPIMFYALPTYKSYKTTQMLIDMLRCATFPREHIQIKGEDAMDTFSRQQRVDEVRRFLENVTPQTQNQDGLSVGSRVYSVSDLFDMDMLEPDIDLDSLGDLEYKRTDMIMATGIPDSYLNPSEGAGDLGGENAESLKYLSKIFQKRCEQLREALLEGISQTFRMHLLLAGIEDGADTEFELSMPNNVEDYNSDKISLDSDVFSFAKDILDSLGSMCGLERGDSLPQEIVIDVLRKYLPVETKTIEKWIKVLYKSAEEQAEENGEDEEGGKVEPIIGQGNMLPKSPRHESKELKEKLTEVVNSHKMNEIYLDTKHNNGFTTNGDFGKRTCFNDSYKRDKYSALNLLKEQYSMNKVKKLEEEKNKGN